jgi:hypothetical protein
MVKGWRRPISWLVAAVTVGAMGATMVLAAPGGAAAPVVERSGSANVGCIVGPGVLNVKATGTLAMSFQGPETVGEGESGIVFTHGSVTINIGELSKSFHSLGASKVTGRLNSLTIDAVNMVPLETTVGPFPIEGSVEEGKSNAIHTTSPEGFSFGPYTVTGHVGEKAALKLDSKPSFTEPEPESFKETGNGIRFEVEGIKENGEHVIGPIKSVCTAPSNATLTEMPITPKSTTSGGPPPPTCTFTTTTPNLITVSPNHGPAAGGTTVEIGGAERAVSLSFAGKQVSFEHLSNGELRAVTPPGTGTVEVFARGPSTPCPNEQFGGVGHFTYEPALEKAEYKNWKLAGSITDKKLGQVITLPEGSTFNGSGEVSTESGAGSVKGNLSIPPFTAALKLFGPLAVNLGLTLSEAGPLEGTVAKSESVPSFETLSAPLKLNVALSSVGIVGLTIPTSCATKEPIALNLVDTLSREELLTKGWSFNGTTSIPRVKCEGGFLSGLFGVILTGLIAGPEDPYALTITAP